PRRSSRPCGPKGRILTCISRIAWSLALPKLLCGSSMAAISPHPIPVAMVRRWVTDAFRAPRARGAPYKPEETSIMSNKFSGNTLVGLLSGGLASLALVGAAYGASYPDHAVTLIVPYPPGGTTDIAARTVAQAMEAGLGQTIVVENRAGAGGNIGMASLARAKPDGYTIGMGTIGTQTINQYLYKDMNFDPEKDFDPIAL